MDGFDDYRFVNGSRTMETKWMRFRMDSINRNNTYIGLVKVLARVCHWFGAGLSNFSVLYSLYLPVL